jgi:hypothetical protein
MNGLEPIVILNPSRKPERLPAPKPRASRAADREEAAAIYSMI